MTTREDVELVFERVLRLIETKEDTYGDAWRACGGSVCISEVLDKAHYIRVQREKDRYTAERLMEDLLDLIAWASFSYYHVEQETKSAT